jgi:hypothetical protein
LFALMSIIWGIPYLFIRIVVAEITPATLVLARTMLAAAILLPIALARVDLRPVLARWRWVVVFAAVEIAIPWIALGSAEQHLSSSLTGLLIAGVPLVGTVLALATGGADRLGRAGVLGLVIGLIGVAAIVGGDYATSDATALLQIAIVVVGYAVGPAILSRRLAGLPSVGVMALSLALCAIAYVPIAAPQWPSSMPSPGPVQEPMAAAPEPRPPTANSGPVAEFCRTNGPGRASKAVTGGSETAGRGHDRRRHRCRVGPGRGPVDPDGRRGAPDLYPRRLMVEAMLWMARTGVQ